ncbi:hypothetical protein O3M35_008028 [Rhynocoris fuscipes]|uniref:Odorant receptor n=1 Tax=Rhynocoris fuscipes TaxID=488301 RepID=A0AAW1DCD9_9HEMI
MNLWQRFTTFCTYCDRDSDALTEKTFYDEYRNLARLSLLYPNLNRPYVFLQILQFFVYFFVLSTNVLAMLSSAFVIESEDFLLSMHAIHLSFIFFLFLAFIFLGNYTRHDFTMIHKIIGNRVFNYNGEDITDEETKMCLVYFKIKTRAKIIIPFLNIIAGFTLFVIGPLVDKALGAEEKRTYTKFGVNLVLPLPVLYPFEAHEGINFYLAFLFQCLSAIIVILILSGCTCIFVTGTTYMIIQLERLLISIKRIETRALHLYRKIYGENVLLENNDRYKDRNYLNCLQICIKRNIQHHQQIMRLCNHFNRVCRGPVFASFFAGGVVLGISALVIIIGGERPGIVLGTLTLIFPEVANLACICLAGQRVIDLNQQVRLSIYSVQWYKYSSTFKPYMSVVQEMTYPDLVIRGLFSTTANMESFGNVLNTAYSYFSLLLAFKKS